MEIHLRIDRYAHLVIPTLLLEGARGTKHLRVRAVFHEPHRPGNYWGSSLIMDYGSPQSMCPVDIVKRTVQTAIVLDS
jgi:hypothetical protein